MDTTVDSFTPPVFDLFFGEINDQDDVMNMNTKIKRMGSVLHPNGVTFRVWVPHADRVSVIGSFNDWDEQKHPMKMEEDGIWFLDVPDAKVGDQYRFWLSTPEV